MRVEERDDIAQQLLVETNHRLRKEHVSVGNAAASVKELTLCLTALWLKKHKQFPEKDWDSDSVGLVKVLLGTAFGDLLNPHTEERIEIETAAGILSGRIDLPDRTGQTIDLGNGTVFDFGEPIPSEVKLTWKSPRKTIEELGQYTEQLAAYVLAKGVRRGRLYVMHIMSYDKSGPPNPKFRCFDIEFSDKEMEDWKKELERRALIALDKERPSPGKYNWDWEKNWCEANITNGGTCPCGPGRKYAYFPVERLQEKI